MGPKAQRKSPTRSKSPKKGGGGGDTVDLSFINAAIGDVRLLHEEKKTSKML